MPQQTSSTIRWYRSPLAPEKLRRLTERSDWKGLVHAGSFFLIYCATTFLCLFFFLHRLWVPMVIAAYIHSVFNGFLGMGAAVHELSHRTAFRTRWLNELFFRLFAFLSWNSYFHFRESHVRHHMNTAFDQLDFEIPREPGKLRWNTVLGWFTFDWPMFRQLIRTNIAHALGNTDVDFFFWCPLLSRENVKTKKLVAWARTLVIGHLLLILVFIHFKLWILIYTVTFAHFFGSFLIHFCGIQQHSGLMHDVPDWRVIAYTARFGRVMSYLYWNMNFHIEHHMYAAVPFYNLPDLHRELSPDLPVQINGFFRGIAHVFRVRKRQRENPEYRFMPEFPATASPPKMG